jgi:Bifunctional DNA primase/polymerase, N-terminal
MSTPTELRMKLRDAGFDPIPTRGKNPGMLEGWAWQKLISAPDEHIAMWRKSFLDAINTGVLTRSTPALDIDILHQEGAEAVEALVQERFEERGYILARIGKSPKRAILFRTGELFP